MAERKDLMGQIKVLGIKISGQESNEKLESLIAEFGKTDTPEPTPKLSLDDQLAKLAEETNEVLTGMTPKLKKIRQTPESKQILIDQITTINGQLKGHSIGPDVRANLVYTLTLLRTGQLEPGTYARRPNKKMTGAGLIPEAVAGKTTWAK